MGSEEFTEEDLNNIQKEKENRDNKIPILFTIFLGILIGYTFGAELNIKKSYNYILDHPNEYLEFLNNKAVNSKIYREKCIEDIERCPMYLSEKRRLEKVFSDDQDKLAKILDNRKNEIWDRCHIEVLADDFTIDKMIGQHFSTSTRHYEDTIEVIHRY